MNFQNGSRAYVDNQTTFILGEGSNLTIGKAENTAGIIGVEGNGKLKINEYKGKDLYNHDSLTTTGGSIGTSGAGISNENHRKEGITRHTVIGNVEIGSATGSSINRDRSKANETTRDDHSSTNVYVESQTIDYALHPAKFKEDVGIAVLEGSATVEGALKKIDNILRGDDNSDISQSEKRRYEEIKENIIRVKTAPDMKLIAEGDLSDPEVQKRLGIGGRFNPDDPNLPEKIKERMAQVREQGQEINYFYDKVTGKIYINENADEDEIRAGIGREWGIRDEFVRGRTKPNGEGQEKGTVAGEIAYKEIEDRTKEKSDKKVNPYDFEYAQFDSDSEVTGDGLKLAKFKETAKGIGAGAIAGGAIGGSIGSVFGGAAGELVGRKIGVGVGAVVGGYVGKNNVNKKYSELEQKIEKSIINNNRKISNKETEQKLIELSVLAGSEFRSKYEGVYVIKDKKLRSEFIDEKNNLRLGKFDPEGLKRVENTKKYKNAVNEIIEKGLEIYNKYGSHVKKGQVGTKYRSEFFKLANSAEGVLSKKANTIEYALGDTKLVGTVHKNVVYNKNGSVTLNVFVKFQISDSFENPAGFPKAPEWGKPYDMLGPERILPLTQGGFPKKFKSIKEYEEYEKSRKAVR